MTKPGLAIAIDGSTLELAGRTIWSELSLSVPRGQFLTVIGPNGAGKTSLLRVLLGLLPARGALSVLGDRPGAANHRIGYVPQQKSFDVDLPMRGRDLVAMGLDGHRWGIRRRSQEDGERISQAIAEVGAAAYAERALGRLSGGEQQRLRIAQALVADPELLLCDEPLLSLDLGNQREICGLIDRWRKERGGTVLFVTHDINPVLAMTDQVLALVDGRWAAGKPNEVLSSGSLSRLYGSPVEVVRVAGRVIVLSDVGDPAGGHHDHSTDPQHWSRA